MAPTGFSLKDFLSVPDKRPRLMGIVNVTPDSFSDGGSFFARDEAVARCCDLLDDGADIIDIGGESTRPGADDIPIREEIRRVVPVIEEFKSCRPEATISVDTRKAEVAAAAVKAGAVIINDVSGLEHAPDMAALAASKNVGLIIMHMRGTPKEMQQARHLDYRDVTGEIKDFLADAARKALDCGVKQENIVIDPGIGFAKTTEQNFQVLGELARLRELGYPLLVGPSRKSFIGAVTGQNNPRERIAGTIGVAIYLAMMEVAIIRVHDVRKTIDALATFSRCVEARNRFGAEPCETRDA